MEHTTKLFFLGTAAADFSPRLKTDCANRFDKDARRASCMMIGQNYMVDCGLYALESLRIAGADISKITDIFVTHTHADHFIADHVAQIAAGKPQPLRLWVRRDAEIPEIPNVEVIHMPRHTVMEVAPGMTVESVDANHHPGTFPQHYIFTIGGKQLLYATDGAWFLYESYRYLRNRGLDMMIIDATCGDYVGDYRMGEHNSIPMIRLMLPSLRTWGALREDSRVLLTHLAPRLHVSHDETVALVAKDGMEVAYDGLELDF